jgi:CMP-N-acetylneuraminic acid synthetase
VKALAIIPARAGSKGLPGKHMADLCGKPVIEYTLRAAEDVNMAYLVTTNDRGVINYLYQRDYYCGGSNSESEDTTSRRTCSHEQAWIRRPGELAQDDTPTEPVIRHALEWHTIVLLQPTSPLRTAEHIREALDIYVDQWDDCPCLISVCKTHYPWWQQPFTDSGWYHGGRGRRQDRQPTYLENGAIYIWDAKALRESRCLEDMMRDPVMYEMDWLDSLQIDEPHDLEMIRLMEGRRFMASDIAVLRQSGWFAAADLLERKCE